MIIVTLAIFGIAKNRARTATFNSSFLLIRRKSLRILKILKVLRLSESGVNDRIEKIMMIKSRTFHDYLK